MTDARAHHIAQRRAQYEGAGIDVDSVDADPFVQWLRWYDEAVEAELVEPNAMTLATVDVDGRPNIRVVLARQFDRDGVVFYTNYESAKSRGLDAHPAVSLNFAWLALHRQVRIRGTAAHADPAASDAYFASRPRGSQLGAWASPQSVEIDSRQTLDRLVAAVAARFEGRTIDRPPNWGGWVVTPTEFEFWQGRPSRLHDRVRYRPAADRWTRVRIAP